MDKIRGLIETFGSELASFAAPLGILALILLGASLVIGLSNPQEGKMKFFYICIGLAVMTGAASIVGLIIGS